jgi:HSP20 family protein
MRSQKPKESIMTVLRWAPFQEIESLHRDMNRFVETFASSQPKGYDRSAFVPTAELNETSEALVLKLEIPGIDAKDLDIQVTSKSVSITGERKTQEETETNGHTRSEFRYGRFHRTVPLPVRVVNDRTKADYKDGILTLTLPKAEDDKQKTYKVELT